MESRGYVRIKLVSEPDGPIAGWTEGPPDDADIVDRVDLYIDADGTRTLQATAEGSGSAVRH